MPGEGEFYLSSYDIDIFTQIIRKAAFEKNCIPSIYVVSLAFYIKKYRHKKAFQLLTALDNHELASHYLDVDSPSKSLISLCFENADIRIVSA